MERDRGQLITWLAIIISIGALILSWLAYSQVRKLGADGQSRQIKDMVIAELHQEIALGSAKANLSAVRIQLGSNESYAPDQAANDVDAIRKNLAQAFSQDGENGKPEYYDTWKKVDADLGTLQSQLKNNDESYNNTFQKIIDEISI